MTNEMKNNIRVRIVISTVHTKKNIHDKSRITVVQNITNNYRILYFLLAALFSSLSA